MKKNFKWLMMAIVTLVMGVSFASCGDDDDDNNPTPPASAKATEAYLQTGVYVSESTLKYFDVVVTDEDGNAVNLTAENTTVVADTVFGNNLDHYKMFFTEKYCNSTDNHLLLWKSDKQTMKNFPVTKKFIVTTTKKDDVKPADEEKVYPVFIPDVEISNNNSGTFSTSSVSGSYSIVGGIAGKNWSKVPVFKRTSTVMFSAADKVSGIINQ